MITDLAYSNWLADRNIAVSKASSAVLGFCLSIFGPVVPVFVVAFSPHPVSILVLSFLFLLLFFGHIHFPFALRLDFSSNRRFSSHLLLPFCLLLLVCRHELTMCGLKGLSGQATTLLVLRKTFFFFVGSVSFAFPGSSFLWYFDIC